MDRMEPIWIDETDARAVHERMLALYGGPEGVRDQGLLQSALARARQMFAYDEGCDVIDMASAYTSGGVKNHPFVDGNKRTGFVLGVLFLELNGYRFTASEDTATEQVMALAAGELDEARYAAFLRANVEPQA